jgi:uncharacterized protein (TIGR02145 family)/uncharacterized repeat protein (TIGR02543 family)
MAVTKFAFMAILLFAGYTISDVGTNTSGRGSFTDPRDGQTYRTARILDLTWMAVNLNFETENSWCYDNDEKKCQRYGRLYDWHTAMSVCPAGWRLPSGDDWDDIVRLAGGWGLGGTKLKSKIGWDLMNGTNEYGFSAIPGGHRDSCGVFSYSGEDGLWWNATEFDADYAQFRLINQYTNAHVGNCSKANGLSVRCVRGCEGSGEGCFTLEVAVTPENGGTVAPGGIIEYDAGAVARITATEREGYMFTGWSGASTSTNATVRITMDGDKTLTASFEKINIAIENFTDPRDGREYRSVKIGATTWMAENLNFKTEKSWCYDYDEENCQKYGRLYDWNAAIAACPFGWRLPTNEDWENLDLATGGCAVDRRLRTRSGWDISRLTFNRGTDEFGFSAMAGGYYSPCGWAEGFSGIGDTGSWWSATESVGGANANVRFIYGNITYDSHACFHHKNHPKCYGYSVRCVREF